MGKVKWVLSGFSDWIYYLSYLCVTTVKEKNINENEVLIFKLREDISQSLPSDMWESLAFISFLPICR